MTRNAFALGITAILSAWLPTTAAAQEGAGIEYVELPPIVAQCVKQCVSPQARAAASEAVVLARRLADLEKKYAELSKKVGLLAKKRSPDVSGELAGIRADIKKLREDLEALTKVTEDEFLRTGIALYDLNQSLGQVQEKLAKMDERLAALEKKSGLKIDIQTGFLVLWSTDGTRYTGAPLGARLKLNLTDSVDVNIDALTLLSISKEPVGTSVRGGLTFDLNKVMAIEAGVSGSWVSINSQLKAKSAFVTGDVGLTFRYGMAFATADLLLGSEFDSGRPAFAIGGAVLVGLEFP
jgi:hypothetical protein